jgi:acetate kinase
MCAIEGGRSVASTMGFSPLDGLPMGTRTGQLDPGVMLYLMQEEGMDADAISDLVYRRSGLLGLSGISSDMRALEASDAPEAAEAIAHFAARIRRETGALVAMTGGLDGLVFTAGIGEHSALLRAAVCGGLGWLGVTLDGAANAAHAKVISASDSAVRVLVIPTDEEAVIARATQRVAGLPDG